MGLLNTLKSAVVDANEQAHAERLVRDLPLTMQQINALPDYLKVQSLERFLELRQGVVRDIANWSRDGSLSIARNFFQAARREHDLNKKDALAYALAGLWLEGGVRNSPKAAEVHLTIENCARDMLGLSRLLSPDELAAEVTRKQAEEQAQRDAEVKEQQRLQRLQDLARWEAARAAREDAEALRAVAKKTGNYVFVTEGAAREYENAKERKKQYQLAVARGEHKSRRRTWSWHRSLYLLAMVLAAGALWKYFEEVRAPESQPIAKDVFPLVPLSTTGSPAAPPDQTSAKQTHPLARSGANATPASTVAKTRAD